MDIQLRKMLQQKVLEVDSYELYNSTKLIKSIEDLDDPLEELIFVRRCERCHYDHDCDGGEWHEIDMDEYNIYYVCLEFPDGRHLPVPLLAGMDERSELEQRPGLQGDILDVAIRKYRPLRRAAIRAKAQYLRDELKYSRWLGKNDREYW